MTLTLGYKFTADQSGVKQATNETVQDLTRLGTAAERAGQEALDASRGVSQLAQAERTLAAAANDAGVRVSRSTAGYRQFGAAAQQVGFQVADVATQISLGANSMQVMAIQGGQLIGAFGPWGAVIGAAVTVVGALAVGLWDAGDATDEAAESQDLLNKAISQGLDITQTAVERSRRLATEREREATETFQAALAERRKNEAALEGLRLDALASLNETQLALDRMSENDRAFALADPAIGSRLESDRAAVERFTEQLREARTETEQVSAAFARFLNAPRPDAGDGGAGEEVRVLVEKLAEGDRARDAAIAALKSAGAQVFEATRSPLERYVAELERLDGLLQASAISQDTFGRASRQAAEELARAQGTIDEAAEATDRLSDLWDGAGDALGRFAGSAIDDIDNVGEAVQRLGDDILKLGYQTLVLDPAREALNGIDISGIIGGFFGGGGSPAPAAGVGPGLGMIYHEGGVIGRTAAPTRAIDTAVIDHAPRFHGGGLVAGEVPVIAQKGEINGWPNQLRHAFGGSDVTVNVYDQRRGGEPVQVRQRRRNDGGLDIDMIVADSLRGMAATGQLDQILEPYGASRVGAQRG